MIRIIFLLTVFISLFAITQFSGNPTSTTLSFNRIPDDFTFDGCSRFPDGDWVQCCESHDEKYFFGGSWEERLEADNQLMQCVADTG